VACWYGVMLLYRPFLKEVSSQVWPTQLHGWLFLYSNSNDSNSRTTGWWDWTLLLPSLNTTTTTMKTLWWNILHGNNDPGQEQEEFQRQLVMLIFPLLGMVGTLQTFFLLYHIWYTAHAYTTLEYKILLEMQYQHYQSILLLSSSSSSSSTSHQLQGDKMDENVRLWKTPPNPFDTGSKWNNLQRTLGPWYVLFLPMSILSSTSPSILQQSLPGMEDEYQAKKRQ
jgi:hypothetical protein